MTHKITRENDEHACSCGLRWGVDEVDPHVEVRSLSERLEYAMSNDEFHFYGSLRGIESVDDLKYFLDSHRDLITEYYESIPKKTRGDS